MNFRYFILLIALLAASCSQPSEHITVATAANVQYVMKEIKAEFEKESGKEIQIVVGSSGNLTTQIREGAPFDVFVSADTKYPEEIFKNGGAEEQPKVYALGSLVLWSKNIPQAELNTGLLTSGKVKKIAIPNPKTAPYGVAAMQVLQSQNLLSQAESKLVYGESIAQTAQYIMSGSAEAGFNALSIVLSPEMKGKGHYITIDPKFHAPIQQAAILLKHSDSSPKKQSSKDFYDFLYSEKGQKILNKYGYASPVR